MLPLGDLRALQAAENVPLHALTQASHTLQAIMKASASEKSYDGVDLCSSLSYGYCNVMA